MQMWKKLYIFKHFAKSKKLFFSKYLSFSVWFLLKFQKKYTTEAPYYEYIPLKLNLTEIGQASFNTTILKVHKRENFFGSNIFL
jgi:hypothetical protein